MDGDLPDDLFASGAAEGSSREARARSRASAASIPVLTSAATATSVPGSTARGHDLEPPPRCRRSNLLAVAAVLLALVVGLATGELIRHLGQPGVTKNSAAVTPLTPGTSEAPLPWQGPTKMVRAGSVTSSCAAPASEDKDGNELSHQPEMAIDGLPRTAWRCNGDGLGQRLIFTFPRGTTLVGVGLVNGYARTEGKESFYDQYRRITSVRWDLPDGSWFIQNLSDNNPALQTLMIPPTRVPGNVRLTILATSKPGRVGEVTRDAVLVSEVSFFAAR